ncbi:MAG: hypothetical protein FJ404_14490 [Verrucomicrobia bacterium]|nr:hypothetical protein [Verrucomicrobiota bacterium]
MAKAEIGWTGRTEDGTRREVYARRVGDRWLFFDREKRYDPWKRLETPPLSDWLELLDAVERRMRRRLLPPEEFPRLRKTIQELFPDAEVP